MILDQQFIKQQMDKILKSTMPSDNKVEKLSNMLNVINKFEAKIAEKEKELLLLGPDGQRRLVASIAQDIGIWKPADIISKTRESIQKAINRLLKSQNQDGGWGFEWGDERKQSKYWDTAWSLLTLHEVLDMTNDLCLPEGMDVAIKDGIDYFRGNASGWSSKSYVCDHEYSNYDMPLVLRSLYAFKGSYSSDLEKEIRDSIELVASKQNPDGGWNQDIWSPRKYESLTTAVIQVYSDVSPTSQVLQALVCIDPERYKEQIKKAFQWILKYQNKDGSWDLGSCHPGREGLYCKEEGGEEFKKGYPTIPKTCDGLQGIFSATKVDSSLEKYSNTIKKAVSWLEACEKPLFVSETADTYRSGHDYTNTSITLEVLVKHPEPGLPLRTLNALWLINNQIKREEGDPDDGKWPFEQTPRIAHSLVQFFKRIVISPLFLIDTKNRA